MQKQEAHRGSLLFFLSEVCLCVHYQTEGETDQHQHDGAEERCEKAANMESRNQGAGQKKNDGVDDQEEESQSQDTDGERHDLEKKSQRCVQETDDEGCDEGTAEACKLKTGDNVGADQQGNRTEQPDK